MRPSLLEADYGACQGLKSSLPGVWPRGSGRGFQCALLRRSRVRCGARYSGGRICGSFLEGLPAFLLPLLHRVLKPRDLASSIGPHGCYSCFQWLAIKEEGVLPTPLISKLLDSAEGRSYLMLC